MPETEPEPELGPETVAGPRPGTAPGEPFGSGYLLEREIGIGGMGTVWRGWARARNQPVAIKILHPHLSGDRTVVSRFLREGDVLTRLDHPNLVKVHDLVVEGGRLGLVMDLVEGTDLHARRRRRGTLRPAEAARIGAQAAGALAAAHALGVVHLDLKPANILISTQPATAQGTDEGPVQARLTDFGIARIVDGADQTTTAVTFGTPDYMAPETALDGDASPASDLYALGITLYELVVGRTPYAGGPALTVLARHLERSPKRMPSIPDALWDVIAACTAREPADRPDASSAAEMLAAAEPALVQLPAADPLPTGTDYRTTSELRHARAVPAEIAQITTDPTIAIQQRPAEPDDAPQSPQPLAFATPMADDAEPDDGSPASQTAESLPAPSHATSAVPALASAPLAPAPLVPAASIATDEPSESALAPTRSPQPGAALLADAAMLKPPPEGPFPTAPAKPGRRRSHFGARTAAGHIPIRAGRGPLMSRRTKRISVLICAPVLLLGAVGGLLMASGAFASSSDHAHNTSQQISASAAPSATGSKSGDAAGHDHSARGASTSPDPAATPSASASTTTGTTLSGSGSNGSGTGASGSGGTGTTGSGGSGGGAPPPASTASAEVDTGWVCRTAGWKTDGALSEEPCIDFDDGTLYLRGSVKGAYDSSVVIALRVDYGGSYSRTYYSSAFVPDTSGTKTLTVTVGSWPSGEDITCQENVDPASDESDYEYGANSADITT